MVLPPLLTAPVCGATSSVTLVIAGASGAVVSGALSVVPGLVFPALSVAVAVTCSPLVNGVPRETVKLPSLPVFPDPITFPFASFSVMVLPGSAVPVTVLPSEENLRPEGAFGGVVSGSAGSTGVLGVGLLLLPSSPPPPPPVLAAAAMPPAATMPPRAHGQMAAPPASLPEEASSTSVEAIDSYVAAPVGSSIHHNAPWLSCSTSWLTPCASVT